MPAVNVCLATPALLYVDAKAAEDGIGRSKWLTRHFLALKAEEEAAADTVAAGLDAAEAAQATAEAAKATVEPCPKCGRAIAPTFHDKPHRAPDGSECVPKPEVGA